MQDLFDWADYVVIGSGIGAAAFAARAVKAQKKVLVLECGSWPLRDSEDWNPRSVLINGRYGAHPLHPEVSASQYARGKLDPVLTRPVIGGMSVFYGGAAFRLREKDFTRWPATCSYEVMAPYYDLAEALMNVHGDDSSDPTRPRRSHKLRPARPPSVPALRIQMAARALGLKPFAIPLAINFSAADASNSSCELCNTCDGFPCKVQAKVDGATILKALPKNYLQTVTSCFVEKINFVGTRAESIDCRLSPGAPVQTFCAKKLILGAGTIGSAALLLKSKCDNSPTLPSFAQFGRYLMRHANGIVGALFAVRTNPEKVFSKQTVIADFYEDFRETTGFATGVIQDIYTPDSAVVRHYAPKGLGFAAGFLSGFIQNLLCISEDEPQATNRVQVDDKTGRILIHHEYTASDIKRRDYLIAKAKKILIKAGGVLPQVMQIDSFSHAIATLRMGESPEVSAVDTNCKIWGIENLWVVDGSVLPASGGVNPSLTISANAMRVADHLEKQ